MHIKFSFVLLTTFLLSCTSNLDSNAKKKYRGADYVKEDVSGNLYDFTIEDGIYCAEVKYYNPQTKTRSEWILEVEIENNKLIR